MVISRIGLLLLTLCLALPLGRAYAASLSSSSIQLHDLRPGYSTGYARFRSAPQVVAGRSLVPSDLSNHGWVSHYEAYYERGPNSPVGVGDALDQFRSGTGAHWFWAWRLGHLGPGFSTTGLPPVGNESSGIDNGTYLGIIFRRGASVADVFVTTSVPDPRDSLMALAHLVDQRLQGGARSGRQSSPRTSGGGLSVQAWVSPNTMVYDSYPTLYARTTPGATCTGDVIYTTGRHPVSFGGEPEQANVKGMVSWSWHEETKGSGGTASVSCQFHGQQGSTTTTFTVN